MSNISRFLSWPSGLMGILLLCPYGWVHAEGPAGTPPPQYRLLENQYGYELIWRARKTNEWPQMELILLSQGADRPRGGPWTYNWVARRDPIFLVSGDLPRIAMLRNYRLSDINPPFFKLGDLRIGLTLGGHRYWLDEIDHIQSQFYAWGTVHRVRLGGHPQVQATLTATLAGARGIAVELQLETSEPGSAPVQVELCYGGLAAENSELAASAYIPLDPLERSGNLVEITPAGGRIQQVLDVKTGSNQSTGVVHAAVEVRFDPPGTILKAEAQGPFIISRHQLALTSQPTKLQVLILDRDETGHEPEAGPEAKSFADYLQASQEFYQHLLNQVMIDTPDPLLNAGLAAAVVNLENNYQAPAWLEGLHKWNSYIVNNYQISAAIALGQLDRARQALLFYGDIPEGPAPNRKSNGELYLGGSQQNDEGLPYFILQLYRYWQATGDGETLNRLWAATSRNLETMLKSRDPERNWLLNWHMGANTFLYQADHLSLPGDAFTPTIFIADDLALMAKMAAARGETERARDWLRQAHYMGEEAQRRLWDAAGGRYRAAIDPQGRVMEATFYTDFVLPMLAPELELDPGCAWVSLRTMDRKLWVGNDLMRVGNYKPPLFGNDQVMPLQMAEAAEAYFRAGRAAAGIRLLHGAARAATVLTDSPGSFPERMSDSGFGQPDYSFGNPAGAFVHGVIAGLFGFERTRTQQTLTWQPCIPEDWTRASLKLDGVSMGIQGRQGDRTYTLELRDAPQTVKLQVPLFGQKIGRVTGNAGQAVQYQRLPHPGGDFLVVNLPAARRHQVRVQTEPMPVDWNPPPQLQGGQALKWRLPLENLKLIDPQQTFEYFKIEGKTLTGKLNSGHGERTLLFEDRERQAMHAVELDLGRAATATAKHLTGTREPLLLDPYFNASRIKAENFWDGSDHTIDLRGKVEASTGNRLMVGAIPFQVRATGTNLVKLEIGALSGENYLEYISENPRSLSIPLGKKIKGLEILNVAEFRIRLTGMRVGEMILCYRDGYRDSKPLVYGDNVDSMIKPFATNTLRDERLGIPSFENLSVMSFTADATREVEKIEIHLTTTDGSLALLAINTVH